MEECFKCHDPETKVLLFDVILPNRLDKICGKCISTVNFPIIKKPSISQEKPKVLTVRETLLRISGIDPREEKEDIEKIKQEEAKLKEIVEENTRKKFVFDLNLSKELIDNFHWVVMRARRMKHITKEQLARSIQEPNEIIELIEKGQVPGRREIVRKLETFLGISIFKTKENKIPEEIPETETELKEKSDLDFKNVGDLTISNLQNMENEKTKITVAASGYFDPLHIGHVEYLEKAKKLGDKLIVILNNDHQTRIKKGSSFMPQEERANIVKSLKSVDEVFISVDEDSSVCKSLELIKPDIFAKGGDRYSYEIPENEICKKNDIKIIDGLGEKIQSSSELLKKHKL